MEELKLKAKQLLAAGTVKVVIGYGTGTGDVRRPVFVRSAARTGGEGNGDEFDYSTLAGFRVARDLP